MRRSASTGTSGAPGVWGEGGGCRDEPAEDLLAPTPPHDHWSGF